MQYQWNVVQMDRLAADGFVTTVHYNVSAVDGEYTASTYGTVSYTPASSPMKPFADLTQAEVVVWVQDSLGKATVEESLAAQITAKKNPTTESGLPWAQAVV